MNERELVSHLSNLVSGYSLNREDGELSNRRKKIQRYHNRELYGVVEESVPGRSRVVTGEVLQAVRWSLPRIVRSCLTGRPVAFQPTSGGDIEAAEDETDVVAHAIKTAPQSFQELHSFAYSMLLMPNAYAKIWWDDTPEQQIGYLEGKTDIELAYVAQDSNATLLDVQPRIDEETGQQTAVPGPQGMMPLYDAVVRYAYDQPRLRIQSIPEEEMLVAASSTSLDLDSVPWVCHRPTDMTESELIAMGFDEDLVKSLPSAEIWVWQSERQTRADTEDELRVPHEPLDGTRRVEVYDWYGFVDFDGDGYAERRHVMYSTGGNGSDGDGGTLINEYCDYQPFVAASAMPQPHRHVGMSQAETAMQWQRVSSELHRQMLNGLYMANGRRAFVDVDRVNMEQYRSVEQDSYIEVEGDPRTAVAPEITQNAIAETLTGIAAVQENYAADTGVSKLVTGIDAKTLAASTMGAYVEAAGASSEPLELVARNFAEHGMAGLYRKAHHLLRTREMGEYMAEVKGKWVSVMPSEWARRTQMAASVGTGTGTPSEKIAGSMAILDLQREALPVGGTTPGRIYSTLKDIVAQLGKGDASRAFLDPDSEEGQQAAAQRSQQAQQRQAEAQRQGETMRELSIATVQNEQAKTGVRQAEAAIKAETNADKSAQDWVKIEQDSRIDVRGEGVHDPSLRLVEREG